MDVQAEEVVMVEVEQRMHCGQWGNACEQLRRGPRRWW